MLAKGSGICGSWTRWTAHSRRSSCTTGKWLLIASAMDDDPVSIRPFDAITFSLGDLWP